MKNQSTRMPLGIYIHVPFCVRKCLYCDFLSAPSDEQTRMKYVDALCSEIHAQASLYKNHEVQTVFLGGGTPSLLNGEQISEIMDVLKQSFHFADNSLQNKMADNQNVEITMEANPGTLTEENLRKYRQAGINRLSIGLQSAHDEELRSLGRIHTWEEFLENYDAARRAGFDNLNIDLMSALPGQSPETWMDTLRRVAALEPEHISAYSLIIEEGTPFYDMYGETSLPTEEEDRLMYAQTKEYLAGLGYERYEFSNYARPGYACRHNSSYWKRTDYVGFGLGSASLCQNVRWSNTSDLQEYLRFAERSGFDTPLKTNVNHLTIQEQMEEFMFLGLRMTEGVSDNEFRECFGKSIDQVYGNVIKKLEKEQLIVKEVISVSGSQKKEGTLSKTAPAADIRLRLTDFGVDVSNYALAEFLF